MRTFQLQFTDDGLGVSKTIEFEGIDASDAYQILEREVRDRTAILLENGKELARICLSTQDARTLGESA